MLRLKPDGFRRVSIYTDLEFGGMTQAVQQMSQSNPQAK